jgi:hypothetical protein
MYTSLYVSNWNETIWVKFFRSILNGISGSSAGQKVRSTGADRTSGWNNAQKTYVGNVYGRIVDAETGEPIKDAEVVLIEESVWDENSWKSRPRWQWGNEAQWLDTEFGNWGFNKKAWRESTLRARSDEDGSFLINSVPASRYWKKYTVIARAEGFNWKVLSDFPVLPGAVMALEVSFALKRGGWDQINWPWEKDLPCRYRHESLFSGRASNQGPDCWRPSAFFDRVDLIGATTANGHVIADGEKFAAAPWSWALNSNWERDIQARFYFQGGWESLPVWDLCPPDWGAEWTESQWWEFWSSSNSQEPRNYSYTGPVRIGLSGAAYGLWTEAKSGEPADFEIWHTSDWK